MKAGKSAGIESPLLAELQTIKSGGASLSAAVYNLSSSIIGAGIMSIPATLKVLGICPALFLIVSIGFLANMSANFLLRSKESNETLTYAGVMEESFGKIGKKLLQICIMITNFGVQVMYLIILGDVLSDSQLEGSSVHLGILQGWFGVHWWNSRAFSLLFTVLFILLPLLLLRRVDSLRYTSAISVLLAVIFVGISSAMAIFSISNGTIRKPRFFPDFHQTSFLDLFTAVPVIVTAFTFHFNVHPIYVELKNPSDMTPAMKISITLCAIIYFAVGLFGYLLFGDSTMPDILTNFDRNTSSSLGSLLNDMVRLSYALHLVLVFPLLNFALRINVDGLLFPKSRSLIADPSRFVSITVALLILIYFAAVVIPNIWTFIQFVGSLTVCLSFIFPGSIVLRDVHQMSSTREKITAATMIVLAVVSSCMAIISSVISLTRTES